MIFNKIKLPEHFSIPVKSRLSDLNKKIAKKLEKKIKKGVAKFKKSVIILDCKQWAIAKR